MVVDGSYCCSSLDEEETTDLLCLLWPHSTLFSGKAGKPYGGNTALSALKAQLIEGKIFS